MEYPETVASHTTEAVVVDPDRLMIQIIQVVRQSWYGVKIEPCWWFYKDSE